MDEMKDIMKDRCMNGLLKLCCDESNDNSKIVFIYLLNENNLKVSS